MAQAFTCPSCGTSIPTVSGRPAIAGPQAARVLAEQSGNFQAQGQGAGRTALWIVSGAAVLCAILAMVILLIQKTSFGP